MTTRQARSAGGGEGIRMLGIVRAIAATCTGLVAGIFLGYLVTAPARAALSASSFVEYEQLVH
ncbi:MAG TPA: hypothetical protein VGN86_13475, partial [Pyrinomonadaceae bacterium]|nr:hypothetical protein [Pyrinomonadaceae bacterium]